MSDKRFIILPNNVVWDNQLDEVVCRCILEGIGDAEKVCQRLNEQQALISALKEENIELKKLKKYCAEWMGVKEENLSLRCVKISEKRFECVFKEHETNNCWSMIKDNQSDKPLYIRDVVALLNEQQVKLEIFEKILPKQLPVECQKCKFFVAYRNFNYEKMTNDTITIYCDLLQNKETYDRDTGDEIWENGWLNECPLRKGGFYE